MNMNRTSGKLRARLRLLAVVILCSGSALAQVAPTASLAGTVTDSSGAVVPAASVTVTNLGTQFTRTTTTGANGRFLLTLLPIGSYRLEASAPGFATYRQTGITLNVDTTHSLNVELSVGEITEVVTVTSEAPMTATESGTLSQIVNTRAVEDLPLNGRNVASLVYLVPGIVTGVRTSRAGYANTDEALAISANGARGSEVGYKLDGGTHSDVIWRNNAIFPNPDAIQEFSVQTNNYNAEYGNSAGAIVNVVTKSGTNEHHGSAFEFLRNGSMNARNFFAPAHDNLKRNQFGATFGGPVLTNKLFFFGSYQGFRIKNTSLANTAFVPSLEMRQGDFSALKKQLKDPFTGELFPNNRVPEELFAPASVDLLGFLPPPQTPDGKILFARPDDRSNNQYLGKLDYNRGPHMISGSFFYVRHTRDGWDGENTLLNSRMAQLQTTKSFTGRYTLTASPNLVNTFIAKSLFLDSFNIRTTPFDLTDFGVKVASTAPERRALLLGITGYSGWGSGSGPPGSNWIRQNHEFSNTVSYITGKHSIQFGAEFVPRIKFESNTGYRQAPSIAFSGSATGDGFADFLTGRVARFRQSGGKAKDMRGFEMSLYVQDKFNVARDFSLNFGLRWDPWWPYTDGLGQVTGFRPGLQSERFGNAPPGLVFAGDSNFPEAGTNSNLLNLAPRFGFAWNVDGKNRTSVRGGYGVFFSRLPGVMYNNFVEAAPFSPSFELRSVDFMDPYGSAAVQDPFPEAFAPYTPPSDVTFATGNSFTIHPNFKTGYIQQWNLAIERQLVTDLLLRTAYVGSKGTRLVSTDQLNPAIFGAGATLGNTNTRRPLYPDFASLTQLGHDYFSTYHSLQISLEKRYRDNLSFLAFYTFSKSIDQDSRDPQFNQPHNPFDRSANRGLSAYHVPHNFRQSFIWDLPRLAGQNALMRHVAGGWSLAGIWTWQSGVPIRIRTGRDRSLAGTNDDRPDMLTGINPLLPSDRPRAQIIQEYFNTDAFTLNPLGTFGTTPRNFIHAPGDFKVDVSLQKQINLSERHRLQFRAEFFNMFNNVNLGSPQRTFVSSRFGRITSAGSPRIVQLGLKYMF